MKEYECKRCGFKHKCRKNYENHLNKKKICPPKISEVSIDFLREELTNYIVKKAKFHQNPPDFHQNLEVSSSMNSYVCRFCGLMFSRSDSLKRHEKSRCKKQNDKVKELERELEIANEKLKTAISTTNINNGNINNGNINIDNSVHYHISSYGREDVSYIKDSYCKKLLRSPMIAVPEIMKKIHFNPEHPENHNVKYTNKKSPFIQVHRDGKWEEAYKKDILNDMIDRSYFMVDYHYDDEKKNMREIEKNRYEEYRRLFDEKDDEMIRRMSDDCTLVLLNNRHVFLKDENNFFFEKK